jgi:uncharacterized protein YndB with AHSA1/START domain
MTTKTETDSIVSEIDIAAPPERVFKALTTSAELAQWFNGGESCPNKIWRMDARRGGRYYYATEKGTVAVNGVSDFECEGEILEFDPPRLLEYTWIANWHLDKKLPTVVRWELTSTAKGTHVKVTHSGLATEAVAREDYRGGWPGVVAHLKAFVEETK